ncbi:MAG: sodium:calcium antiporter [Rhodobacteraceae bacterium CG17_big_fil_post_rev_8_21_14_2_50_65_11]|nr:MAG: sodium:calcium antiporter [Rhodobacteraceae bacterium CG17_big_fil_post_rev_8_21_14_2_50_65_11]PJB36701.1 MAG: sodium:calcium antiporter [Deltaproteobacteria bacterium CG_4_9_14_3_um_filter_63_12]
MAESFVKPEGCNRDASSNSGACNLSCNPCWSLKMMHSQGGWTLCESATRATRATCRTIQASGVPNMIVDVLLLAVGLVVLYFGAEWLVTASSKLAFALGVTPLVIGLTVVAYGTSAPEMVVSVAASARGNGALSLGNIVGSNICNIGLILGTAALIRPVHVAPSTMRLEYPVLLAGSVALYAMAWMSQTVGRMDGALLLAGIIAYTVYAVRSARKASRARRAANGGEEENKESKLPSIGLALVGLVALVIGAELMVRSAVSLALQFGVPDFVIAVSVVAFGTSVPELATSAVAALKNESDISVGNVIGSNLCNALFIIGVVGLVFELPVDARSLTFDFPIMIGFTVVLYPIMRTGFYIGRMKGGFLLLSYASYVLALFLFR